MSKISQAKLGRSKKHEEKRWYNLTQEDIFEKLGTSKNGLTLEEVAKRQKQSGPNKLPAMKRETRLFLFLKQFKSSLVYILLIAAIISMFLGDYIDAGVIMLAVIINVVIGFYQENKAQTALSALNKIVVNQCKVTRNNHQQEINTDELVPGDIVFLGAGDKVPADLRLFKVNNLKINEAPLTGESVEVAKTNKTLSGDLIIADQINMAFMGTQVTQGGALGVVVGTSEKTALGKIAQLVATTENLITPLQRKLNIFAKKISLLVLGICALIFLIGLLSGYGFTQIFTTAVAIAVSAIPEGLLVVVTMILAVGMQKILREKTLVKHLLAAEILGSTSVICTDKTGTLTEGEMRIVEVATMDYNLNLLSHEQSKDKAMGEELIELLEIGVLCNNAYIENPEAGLAHRIVRGNPTEKALLMAGANIGLDKYTLEEQEPRLDEIPFDSQWKYMLTLNQGRTAYNTVYIKGAPEIILNFSQYLYSTKGPDNKIGIDKNREQKLIGIYEEMSRRGLRVLAAGYKKVSPGIKSLKGVTMDNFIFVGLLGLKDPIRAGIKETIKDAGRAGIKTIMITGDHKLTATAIAQELELAHGAKNIINGEKMDKLNQSQLLEIIDDLTVYARVTPKHKLKIVKAWQEKGKVVAMTGDGINDAPALKRANIGIAVGSGTDVAKETADAILLDNNFKTIIAAVKEGRVIFDNIKKVILYFLSDSFSEMIIITVSLFLGWPLPLLATQIIWINLIDDTFPALAMTQEPAEKDIMKQKPRGIKEPILDNESKFLISLISILSAVGSLFFFYHWHHQFGEIDMARTMAFTFLAISTLIYVFSIRTLNKPLWQTNPLANKFLVGAVIIGLGLQAMAIYNPFLQSIFHTMPLGLFEWTVIVCGCSLLVLIIEIIKAFYYRQAALKALVIR